MQDELKNTIEQCSFTVMPGIWIYSRVTSAPKGKHFMVTQDEDEITVVTEKKREKELDVIERNNDEWSLISLNVSTPFYSVGFLAEVSRAIAEAGLNILVISTYSKDYILIKRDSLRLAKQTLLKLGMNELIR